jgi:hypothetical protein
MKKLSDAFAIGFNMPHFRDARRQVHVLDPSIAVRTARGEGSRPPRLSCQNAGKAQKFTPVRGSSRESQLICWALSVWAGRAKRSSTEQMA